MTNFSEIDGPLPDGTSAPFPRDFGEEVPAKGSPSRPVGLWRRGYSWIRWLIAAIFSGIESLLGLVSLLIGLAFLAAVPILQFLSLGYLLESGGRVARTGQLRQGFIGLRQAAQMGSLVLGSWLVLLPVRLVSGVVQSAWVIDPGGEGARRCRLILLFLIGLTALHLIATWSRGSRLLYFFWPFNVLWMVRRIRQGNFWGQSRDAVWDTFASLRLPYYFWLGCRGFLGALIWLIVPVSLLALGRLGTPGAIFLGLIGSALFIGVVLYLPFLQIRLASTNRLKAVFAMGAVTQDYCRAPWAMSFAFVVTLLSALPLYLLKIEMIPRDAAWLVSLFFVAFIFPARLLTGWAVARAQLRPAPRHWFFRWTGRLPLWTAAIFYVLVVYFTQFTSWYGIWSLYEQHAFLLPVPFLGM